MKTVVKAALVAAVTFGLAGCGMQTRSSTPTYAQAMQQAKAQYSAQEVDGAKKLYQQAANLNPTAADPWYQLAKINFDQQNYGRSIVDSQEVLRREPANTGAQTILTVAGLRVAIQALGRLHNETNMQGPAHIEAEKLAAKMRDVLGQNVLVPPEERHHEWHRRARHVEHAVSETKKAVAPAKPATPPPANPFQALPGSSSGG